MSSLPNTSHGGSGTPLFSNVEAENLGKISLDPNLISIQESPGSRPQTPISGVAYTSSLTLKLKSDTDAKIANLLGRAVELKLGRSVDNDELQELVEHLILQDVQSLLTCLLILVCSQIFHTTQL